MQAYLESFPDCRSNIGVRIRGLDDLQILRAVDYRGVSTPMHFIKACCCSYSCLTVIYEAKAFSVAPYVPRHRNGEILKAYLEIGVRSSQVDETSIEDYICFWFYIRSVRRNAHYSCVGY